MPESRPHDLPIEGVPRPAFIDVLGAELLVAAATLAPTIGVTAQRVGVLADTHCVSTDGSDLPDAVLDALEGCDLILHCGDLDALGYSTAFDRGPRAGGTQQDRPRGGRRSAVRKPAAGPRRPHPHRHDGRLPRSHGSSRTLRHRCRPRPERHQPHPARRPGRARPCSSTPATHHPAVEPPGRRSPRSSSTAPDTTVRIVHLPKSH